MLLGPAVDGEHKKDGNFIFAKSISSYPMKPKCVLHSLLLFVLFISNF